MPRLGSTNARISSDGAPYGSGREWASTLPDARLLTIPGAGHASWLEAPDVIFPAIRAFLRGEWPKAEEKPQ